MFSFIPAIDPIYIVFKDNNSAEPGKAVLHKEENKNEGCILQTITQLFDHF